MNRKKFLRIRAGDLKGKAYAKYYNPQMQSIQKHVQRALLNDMQASEFGFPIEEANQLLDPGYLPLENGYARLKNGQVLVAALTKMPGVTGKMIDWWFGWYYMESQRYMLWHPRAHVMAAANQIIADDPNYSDREKFIGNTHHISEYIGKTFYNLAIAFYEPESMFLDPARFDKAGIRTAICGRIGFQKLPIEMGHMVHIIRETEEGCEMRSRFWLGAIELRYISKKGLLPILLGSRAIAHMVISDQLGRNLLVHCAMEMNHLAGFLPDLYRDYHRNV